MVRKLSNIKNNPIIIRSNHVTHVGSFCSLILFSWIIWARWSSKSFSFKDKAARKTWSNTNTHTWECSREWALPIRSMGLEWRIWSILMFSSDKKVLNHRHTYPAFRGLQGILYKTSNNHTFEKVMHDNSNTKKWTTHGLNDSLTIQYI